MSDENIDPADSQIPPSLINARFNSEGDSGPQFGNLSRISTVGRRPMTLVEEMVTAVGDFSKETGLEQGAAGTFSKVIFPSSLNTQEGLRPVVRFFCIGGKDHKEGTIILPAPSSFATADTAQYGDTDLGFGGKLAMDLTRSATSSEGRAGIINQANSAGFRGIDDLKNIFSAGGALEKRREELTKAAVQQLGAKMQGKEGISKGVAMAIGATFNKNVTTEFTSVSTRGFSFSYELIPSTPDEGQDIHNMIVAFREAIYPAPANFGSVLRYPPKWKIEFLEGVSGYAGRLKSFPALAECYLESFSTTYNGNNSFHTDGRPVKTDIQLSFKEDRALTLDDIKELEESEASQRPGRL